MSFLLNGRPNWIVPLFRQIGNVIEYKRFPADYKWREFLDLSSVAGDASEALETANEAQSSAEAALLQLNQLNFTTTAFYGDEMWYSVGTPSRLVTAQYPYNWVTFTTTQHALCHFVNLMDAGTWEINIMTAKANNFGKLSVTIDGDLIINDLDLYSASTIIPFIHTQIDVVLTGDKVREWTFFTDDKHGSSAAYAMIIVKVWARKTG